MKLQIKVFLSMWQRGVWCQAFRTNFDMKLQIKVLLPLLKVKYFKSMTLVTLTKHYL